MSDAPAVTDRASTPVTDAVAAATVILLRDGAAGIETLMLRRNSALDFAGGAWVFPGGRVDPEDVDADAPEDELLAARNAAVREAREEADIVLDSASFVLLSRWCPPPEAPKRFNTWFFVAAAPDAHDVTIDGSEIHDHGWISPEEAMRRRDLGEVELFPPTWITLRQLLPYDRVDDAIAGIRTIEPEYFVTRVGKGGGPDRIIMWHGDAGYTTGEVDTPGPRHRLVMRSDGWIYDRTIDG